MDIFDEEDGLFKMRHKVFGLKVDLNEGRIIYGA